MNYEKHELLLRLSRIIEPYLPKDYTLKIKLRNTFEALGIDSLDMVEIVMEAEEVFYIYITDEELEQIETIGDLLNIVDKKLIEKAEQC